MKFQTANEDLVRNGARGNLYILYPFSGTLRDAKLRRNGVVYLAEANKGPKVVCIIGIIDFFWLVL